MANDPRQTLLGRSTAAKSTAGKTRVCPHCKATILDSANICPACQGYLRFTPTATEWQVVPNLSPLRVAATIQHPEEGDPWEYSVVLSVRNEKGEEITRQVVGVGSLRPREQRTFNLAVEIFCSSSQKKE
jgi:hypothetical protein